MSYGTANLQMLHFIYYSTNIRTEYFKHAAYSPFFSLQNTVYLIMLPFFGSCVIHILYTGVLKYKKNSGSKGLMGIIIIIIIIIIIVVVTIIIITTTSKQKISSRWG